jgi:hypothetical protein
MLATTTTARQIAATDEFHMTRVALFGDGFAAPFVSSVLVSSARATVLHRFGARC